MNPPPLPPLFRDQRKTDAEQLNLLVIFHFVVAGLAVVGICFLILHYGFMRAIISNPEAWKGPNQQMPPAEFFAFFKWFYVVGGIVLVLGAVANVLSGLFLQRRTNRMFSLVVAGLNCIQIPIGTILGVFTIVVLARDSVRELYEAERGRPGGPSQ